MSPGSECGLSPASRQDMVSHNGLEGGVSVEASSARGVAGWSLFRIANEAGSAIDTVTRLRDWRCVEGADAGLHTVVKTLEPSIGLILYILSHFVELSIQMRLNVGVPWTWTGRCLPLDSGRGMSVREHKERIEVG